MKTSRKKALLHVLLVFVGLQGAAYAILILADFSSLVRTTTWLHGLAGPFVVYESMSRFRYQSLLSNIIYSITALVVLFIPFLYVIIPRRPTLAVSSLGIGAWIIFGLLHSIHHM